MVPVRALHWKLVGRFAGKRYFSGNGIHTYILNLLFLICMCIDKCLQVSVGSLNNWYEKLDTWPVALCVTVFLYLQV